MFHNTCVSLKDLAPNYKFSKEAVNGKFSKEVKDATEEIEQKKPELKGALHVFDAAEMKHVLDASETVSDDGKVKFKVYGKKEVKDATEEIIAIAEAMQAALNKLATDELDCLSSSVNFTHSRTGQCEVTSRLPLPMKVVWMSSYGGMRLCPGEWPSKQWGHLWQVQKPEWARTLWALCMFAIFHRWFRMEIPGIL